MYRRAL